jgi:hypothetical protein
MATSSNRNAEFCEACSGSEIKGLPLFIWGGLDLPKCGDVFYSVAFRSSYPLAGCSPAEPTFVSLDDQSLTVSRMGSMVDRPTLITHTAFPTNTTH